MVNHGTVPGMVNHEAVNHGTVDREQLTRNCYTGVFTGDCYTGLLTRGLLTTDYTSGHC